MNFENQPSINSSENEKKQPQEVVEENVDNSQESREQEDGESVFDECFRHMKSGAEVGTALKEIGKEALNQGIENRQKAWEGSAAILANMNKFSHLETASDDELENEYLKNFESQSSNLYLGNILSAMDSEAFRLGFFNAYHDKTADQLDEKLLKTAKIVERLTKVAKKIKMEASNQEK